MTKGSPQGLVFATLPTRAAKSGNVGCGLFGECRTHTKTPKASGRVTGTNYPVPFHLARLAPIRGQWNLYNPASGNPTLPFDLSLTLNLPVVRVGLHARTRTTQ
jgi:hypothetical protein